MGYITGTIWVLSVVILTSFGAMCVGTAIDAMNSPYGEPGFNAAGAGFFLALAWLVYRRWALRFLGPRYVR